MKLGRLVRLEKTTEGFIGDLLIDGRVVCRTLERDDTFIKPGCYCCDRYHSAKYPDTFEIKVPGHTKVLFHALNTEDETEGCVGDGSEIGYDSKGRRAILEARDAMVDFMKAMGKDLCFTLFVEDYVH